MDYDAYQNGPQVTVGSQDDLGIGLMDPTTASGEILQLTQLDALSIDVIGYDRILDNSMELDIIGVSEAYDSVDELFI